MHTALRRERVGHSLPSEVDALLVTSPVNLRYLCGLSSSNAALLLNRDGSATLATDSRYLGRARGITDVALVESRSPALTLVETAVAAGTPRLGLEADAVTVAQHCRLTDSAPTAVLHATSGVVEAARTVKDAAEIAALRRACAITDQAFEATLGLIRSGITEREVAWQLEKAMREAGAEAPAFDSIVAFGDHSAIPHHEPTDRPCRRGDLVKLDFGARYDGYHADMTRTLVAGSPADWQQDLHDLVRGIQAECTHAVVVGARPGELNRTAAARVEAAGYAVLHGLGHGVGLAIHEDPFLAANSTAEPLSRDTTVTVEPGIYLPGQGGVRIEDTVLVTDAGAERLTSTSRELISCG